MEDATNLQKTLTLAIALVTALLPVLIVFHKLTMRVTHDQLNRLKALEKSVKEILVRLQPIDHKGKKE